MHRTGNYQLNINKCKILSTGISFTKAQEQSTVREDLDLTICQAPVLFFIPFFAKHVAKHTSHDPAPKLPAVKISLHSTLMSMHEKQGRGCIDEGRGIVEKGALLSWEKENFPAGR